LTVYPELRTVVGSSVQIPCNITLSSASDAVKLILWYKGSDVSGSPIYSVDARSSPLSSAQHFISNSIENRAKVDLSVRPAILKIDQIIDSDDDQYWCRVDFRWTRTSISVVTISVIGIYYLLITSTLYIRIFEVIKNCRFRFVIYLKSSSTFIMVERYERKCSQ